MIGNKITLIIVDDHENDDEDPALVRERLQKIFDEPIIAARPPGDDGSCITLEDVLKAKEKLVGFPPPSPYYIPYLQELLFGKWAVEKEPVNACPFCGSGDTMLTHEHKPLAATAHFVKCVSCGARGSAFIEGAVADPKGDALSTWNDMPGYAE